METQWDILILRAGTRQGDPLSPYPFILALEISLIQVRADFSVKGFRIKQFEIKLTAYADDTTFCGTLRKIIKLLKNFEEFSSLKINIEKCEACWILRAKNRNTKPVKCKWTSLTKISIKILGICFSDSHGSSSIFSKHGTLYATTLQFIYLFLMD